MAAGDQRKQKQLGKGRHTSAIKRHRQSLKRQARNKHIRSLTKTAVKSVRAAVTEKNKGAAETNLKKTISLLHKAASKGVIPKARASRLSSRLAKSVATL